MGKSATELIELLGLVEKQGGVPTEEQKRCIKELKAAIKEERARLSKILLKADAVKGYAKLASSGRTQQDILRYKEQDELLCQKAEEFVEEKKAGRKLHLGYPVNVQRKDGAYEEYYREEIESKLPIINNIGGYGERHSSKMVAKDWEEEVIRFFFNKFGIAEESGFGYITSGGAEGNTWGIRRGFIEYPNAIFYSCEAAHYSAEKVFLKGMVERRIIPPSGSTCEKIDTRQLFESIKKNWEQFKKPAVILLTWGTTKRGSIDDVREIKRWLEENHIPHYIHLDAALFGGIPKNQVDAPVVPPIDELGVDSISVSLHKYPGVPYVNGVLVSRHKPSGELIEYIKQKDTTISGCRQFEPFSTYQRLIEMDRSLPTAYRDSVQNFKELLDRYRIKYEVEPQSNTFIFARPSEEICERYQLCPFESKDGLKTPLAHAIIFPEHKQKLLEEFVKVLRADLEKKGVGLIPGSPSPSIRSLSLEPQP